MTTGCIGWLNGRVLPTQGPESKQQISELLDLLMRDAVKYFFGGGFIVFDSVLQHPNINFKAMASTKPF